MTYICFPQPSVYISQKNATTWSNGLVYDLGPFPSEKLLELENRLMYLEGENTILRTNILSLRMANLAHKEQDCDIF